MKNIYLLVGESGSGKTTIQEELSEQYRLKPVVSYTTRKPRYEGEDNHIFVSDEEYDTLKDIVAETVYRGKRYCATASQVAKCDLYTIDPEGIKSLKENYKGKKGLKVIYISSPLHTRYVRMHNQGRPTDEILQNFRTEMSIFSGMKEAADLVVNNGDDSQIQSIVDYIYRFIKETEKASKDE